MKTEQLLYENGKFNKTSNLKEKCNWALVFGDRNLIEKKEIFDEIRKLYPSAYIMGCSTAGEIQENYITDKCLNVTGVNFERSHVVCNSIEITKDISDYELGALLATKIDKTGLKHVFILTDGINIDGSKFISGLTNVIGDNIPITGGLSGDNSEFIRTSLIANTYAKDKIVVYAAFYGDIKIGYSANGGWNTFGIERVITKADNNIIYEFDFKPALNIYKKYLGELAKKLPVSGYRFPLSIRHPNTNDSFVRSLVDIDEENKSIIVGGYVPEGAYCRLMKSNTYNLIDATKIATENSLKMLSTKNAELAIVISCCGRRAVLKQRIDEEVENIQNTLGKNIIITGFYSYGEIGHSNKNSKCEMHNQTMTITLFSE